MEHTLAEQKNELIERVAAMLEARLPADHVAQVVTFCRVYYADVPPEDLLGKAPDDLYGALLAHWNFARRRAPGTPLIRAYNPNFDEYGWQSTHSVVEIVADDMPFLVDSVIMELNRLNMRVHLIIHPVMQLERDADGELARVLSGTGAAGGQPESVMHCEFDRQSDKARLDALEQGLARVLQAVRTAVEDWPAMHQRLLAVLAELDDRVPGPAAETAEIKAFLQWIADNHFTFLGSRDYDLVEKDGEVLLYTVPGSGLGVLRDDGKPHVSPSFAELPPKLRQLASDPTPLIVSKAAARSNVHRPSHMDYIGIKRFDDAGRVIGEHRFLGLYSAAAYTLGVHDIPLLRAKAQRVLQRSGHALNSHAGRALQNILEIFPRDELFQANDDQLFAIAMGILHLQERQKLRLFVREDMFHRFVSCLIYVPRDRYNTTLRERMEAILMQAFNSESATFSTQFSESVLARVHFHLRTKPGAIGDYVVAELEARMREAMLSWTDQLYRALLEDAGEARGTLLNQCYGHAFPAAYREDFQPRIAVSDIHRLETLSAEQPLAMWLYRSLENPDELLHFKVFGQHQPLPLSEVLPILERMGLRVLTAHPYQLELADGHHRWLLNFDMREDFGIQVDVAEVKDIFQGAFASVWDGVMENDGFNRLVLGARIPGRDVVIIRAYSKYLLQTRVPFSQEYMQQTLCQHPQIVRLLVDLFHACFDPERAGDRESVCSSLTDQIEAALDAVSSLDEDRILRRFLAIVQATLRTNFYQRDSAGQPKEYLSFKFDPHKIPELPKPLPMYEIFVYSARVEAVHLRGGPVARGGLRWSDRREDFRTEVLGLMKAQMVKNSVIVPVGSKGGFVVKRMPQSGGREAVQQEVQECYKTFIRGMLDITDNRLEDRIVPPPRVVRHDGDDPYLVVAADKGTATFSDLANSVAEAYGFWLGDAFASGGAHGYDHKKMGITARGAWESVKRHFRELDMDIQKRDDFTVIGIGDMSGDVFGNGMLLSRHIKLVAAFNHLHIFLDPDPDTERSFGERERLFQLPRSSWDDYDQSLISAGGGVYPRTAKSIPISPEVRRVMGIHDTRLTPMELISRLLKAPVDLLWNGGIGTYVKASSESHADVGDKTNDALRVNGNELRCRVVGEGGNLGFTQLGRIEYTRQGGRMLTDAIDNSGGVNCSDHEVNIKILLDQAVTAGDMTTKQRNELLAAMTDEVGDLVLRQNYLQPEAISVTRSVATEVLGEHARVIRALERSGKLDRALEFLPDAEQLAEREAAGAGLTGPELAVLLAYGKISLFEALCSSDVPEDSFLQRELLTYFPTPLRERFSERMQTHPLRREIIATCVTNSVLNRMGSTYVIRIQEDSGETAPEIARAYSAAREIFGARRLWQQIDALDTQVPADIQIRMHLASRRLLENASLWLLRNRRSPIDIEAVVGQLSGGVQEMGAVLPGLLRSAQQEEFEQSLQSYVGAGVSEELARAIVSLPVLYSALDITDVAVQSDLPVTEVAGIYFGLAEQLQITWLYDSIGNLPVTTHWQRRARAALLDGLYDQGRTLTADVLRSSPPEVPVEERLEQWLERNKALIDRCLTMFSDLQTAGQPDLAMLSVALRETGNLAQAV